MTEPTSFRRYRVLQEEKARFAGIALTELIVFDASVQLGRWAEFEGDVLRQRFGAKWPRRLERELGRGLLRIVGVDESGNEHTIMLDKAGRPAVEERPASGEAAVESSGAESGAETLRGRGGRSAGTGLRLLVRHLKDESGIGDYGEMLSLLEASEIPWIQLAMRGRRPTPASVGVAMRWKGMRRRVAKAYSNGKSHGPGCPFCVEGLPPALNKLVIAFKRTHNEVS